MIATDIAVRFKSGTPHFEKSAENFVQWPLKRDAPCGVARENVDVEGLGLVGALALSG